MPNRTIKTPWGPDGLDVENHGEVIRFDADGDTGRITITISHPDRTTIAKIHASDSVAVAEWFNANAGT